MLTRPTSLLVIGSTVDTRAFVRELEPWLGEPVIRVTCGEHVPLEGLEAAGTVVLHDIDKLSLPSQRDLMQWLDVISGQTWVISTSRCALMPRVATRSFLDTLYYRLNLVYIELRPRPN